MFLSRLFVCMVVFVFAIICSYLYHIPGESPKSPILAMFVLSLLFIISKSTKELPDSSHKQTRDGDNKTNKPKSRCRRVCKKYGTGKAFVPNTMPQRKKE